MCGIVGAVIRNYDIEVGSILEELLFQSRIRGMHSYGVSVKRKNKPMETIVDSNMTPIYRKWMKCPDEPFITVAHCRYSTSGEQGQPLHLVPETSLVFNGNIHMGTKEEMEQYFSTRMATDNDGEIFVKKFLQAKEFEDVLYFLESDKISFAGLILHGHWLIAMRNAKRPLYAAIYGGNIFYASTFDIFQRTGIMNATLVKANACVRNGLL